MQGQGLPPKPSFNTETPLPRNDTKRVQSPPPPPKSSQVASKAQNTSRIASDVSKSERRAKQTNDTMSRPSKRRSPIYTSSEEESNRTAKAPERVVQRKQSKPTAPRIPTGDPRKSAPLSTDHTSLRSRYSTVYVDYIAVFQKVVAQKNKIERRLKGGSGSSTSEEDIDMMSAEELEQLSTEHKRLQDELQSIRIAWGR